MRTYLLALDQGTTSPRALLLDQTGNVAAVAQREFEQIFPQAGWVEHNPIEIWSTQVGVVAEVTAGRCDKLKRDGFEDLVQEKTGLVIDPYFSGTKVAWILDNVAGARQKAERGELAFGTVDSWLAWKLTEGALHVTDETNASRTMLFNIQTRDWDDQLLQQLDVPRSMLPSVKSSSEVYSECAGPLAGGPDRRHCRGSAIGSVRADVPSSRDGQEYIWNRLLHVDEYGEEPGTLSE